MTTRVAVTGEHLRRMQACQSDRRRFKRLFGEKAFVTKANLLKAANAGLGVGWFLEQIVGRRIGSFWCTCRDLCCESPSTLRLAVKCNVQQVERVWPEIREALPYIKKRLAKVLA